MSQEQPSPDITTLLQGAQAGHAESQQRLAEAVYTQLRHIANERSSHTLQPTALVNEAYIRLFFNRQVQWENRDHFFAIAASQIRRILIDSARSRQAAKREGIQLELHDADDEIARLVRSPLPSPGSRPGYARLPTRNFERFSVRIRRNS